MKNKINTVISGLSDQQNQNPIDWASQGSNDEGTFEVEFKNKKAFGKVHIGEEEITVRIAATNYNRYYLRGKIRQAFMEEGLGNLGLTFITGNVQSGLLVNTRKSSSGLTIGDQVTLVADTKIHGYGDEPLDCNGSRLGSEYEAIYRGIRNESCIGSPFPPDAYSQFELQ